MRTRRLRGFDPGQFIVGQGRSVAINNVLQAANLSFPGAGILISAIFSRLIGESESAAETRAHFADKVIGPIIEAARTKNFALGAGLLSDTPAGREHFGYIYERARSIVPAAYAVVIGHALSTKSYGGALAFARYLDQLERDAEADRINYEMSKEIRPRGPGRTDTD